MRANTRLVIVGRQLAARNVISEAAMRAGIECVAFRELDAGSSLLDANCIVLIEDQADDLGRFTAGLKRECRDVPVVAYRENAISSRQVQAMLKGALGYIVLPAPASQIARSLESYARRAGADPLPQVPACDVTPTFGAGSISAAIKARTGATLGNFSSFAAHRANLLGRRKVDRPSGFEPPAH